MRVVTYRLAYLPTHVSLCAACAASYDNPLGPVQHGTHEGVCEECERREEIAVDDEAYARREAAWLSQETLRDWIVVSSPESTRAQKRARSHGLTACGAYPATYAEELHDRGGVVLAWYRAGKDVSR